MTAMIFSASDVLIYPCASDNYRGTNVGNVGITVERMLLTNWFGRKNLECHFRDRYAKKIVTDDEKITEGGQSSVASFLKIVEYSVVRHFFRKPCKIRQEIRERSELSAYSEKFFALSLGSSIKENKLSALAREN